MGAEWENQTEQTQFGGFVRLSLQKSQILQVMG